LAHRTTETKALGQSIISLTLAKKRLKYFNFPTYYIYVSQSDSAGNIFSFIKQQTFTTLTKIL